MVGAGEGVWEKMFYDITTEKCSELRKNMSSDWKKHINQ